MATTKKRPSRGRGQADSDPNGRYLIKYQIPNPCVRPDTSWLKASQPTFSQRVRGKRARDMTVSSLRASGATIISVTRTNWFT